MRAARKRYRDRLRLIRRLYREDEEFMLDWDDYRLARKALRHFRTLGEQTRADEYRLLSAELAQAVRRRIETRS